MKIKVNKIFIVLMVMITGLTCCKRCDQANYYSIDFAPLTKQYFSCYKSGSYFIYLNQDSSKRDSFSISYYQDTIEKNTIHCFSHPLTQYCIMNTYLNPGSADSFLDIVEDIYGSDNTTEILGGGFSGYYNTTRTFGLAVNSNANEFSVDDNIAYNGASVHKIESYKLWDNILPEVTLYTDSRYGDIYFAPNIGIAEFITNDKKDTFKIIKYYIP